MKNLNLSEATKNINVSNGAIMCAGKDAVAIYTLLAIKGALKMESLGMKGRVSAVKCAQSWLDHLEIPVKLPRVKVKALEVYTQILKEIGVLKEA